MKWFLPFLACICCGELVATYQSHVLKIESTGINYLIAIMETVFYGYLFYHLSNRTGFRKLVACFVCTSTAAYAITFLLRGNDLRFFFPNIIISGFLLAAIALAYLYLKVTTDDDVHLLSDAGFWIALGISLFYSGITICFSLYGLIRHSGLRIFNQSLINGIPQWLCVLLYVSLSLSIISCKPKNKVS
ncbi:MAG: hypothetical protein JWQ78_1303 [Sediminibacterium sp.]|nr:hypothetical protein [Sediminibacterium sp.]